VRIGDDLLPGYQRFGKIYIKEEGSDKVKALVDQCDIVSTSVVAYPAVQDQGNGPVVGDLHLHACAANSPVLATYPGSEARLLQVAAEIIYSLFPAAKPPH
jgi:hypothetical protein